MENIKIDTKILLHYRKKEKHTQVSMAKQIGISERGYQKIESTGNTSSETGTRIAECLKISLEQLCGEEISDTAQYWLTSSENFFFTLGFICSSYFDVVTKIRELDPYSDNSAIETIIKLKASTTKYRLDIIRKYQSEERHTWFEFKKIIYNEEIGLVWSKESEVEKEELNYYLDDYIFDTASEFYRNDKRIGKNSFFKLSVETANQKNSYELSLQDSILYKEEDLNGLWATIQSFIIQYSPDSCTTSTYTRSNIIRIICLLENIPLVVFEITKVDVNDKNAPFPRCEKDFINQSTKIFIEDRISQASSLSLTLI